MLVSSWCWLHVLGHDSFFNNVSVVNEVPCFETIFTHSFRKTCCARLGVVVVLFENMVCIKVEDSFENGSCSVACVGGVCGFVSCASGGGVRAVSSEKKGECFKFKETGECKFGDSCARPQCVL